MKMIMRTHVRESSLGWNNKEAVSHLGIGWWWVSTSWTGFHWSYMNDNLLERSDSWGWRER